MVPSEGMYASSFSPPAMPIDYSGYALGGAPTPETGYGGGYYGAAMPFAGQDPSVPIPIALPRTSRPVTLKSPTGDDRR